MNLMRFNIFWLGTWTKSKANIKKYFIIKDEFYLPNVKDTNNHFMMGILTSSKKILITSPYLIEHIKTSKIKCKAVPFFTQQSLHKIFGFAEPERQAPCSWQRLKTRLASAVTSSSATKVWPAFRIRSKRHALRRSACRVRQRGWQDEERVRSEDGRFEGTDSHRVCSPFKYSKTVSRKLSKSSHGDLFKWQRKDSLINKIDKSKISCYDRVGGASLNRR